MLVHLTVMSVKASPGLMLRCMVVNQEAIPEASLLAPQDSTRGGVLWTPGVVLRAPGVLLWTPGVLLWTPGVVL